MRYLFDVMRYILGISILCMLIALLMTGDSGAGQIIRGSTVIGGGGGTSISDDFATTPTSRWTALAGVPSWSANDYFLGDGVYARNNTELATTSNYVKIRVLSGGYFSILLRNTGTGGAYSVDNQGTSVGVNEVFPGGPDMGWVYDGPSGTLAIAENDTVAVTITGTGTSTTVRVWKNPTNNTPATVSGWDSSGDTADLTISLSSYAGTFFNTGKYVGLGYWAGVHVDDFYAGDI